MRALHRLKVFLRSWCVPGRLDAELREELQFHLERQIEANLSAGMTPDDARRAAFLAFGGSDVIRETSREGRAGALVHQLARDISYGTRLARKSPAFATVCVAIVALGIGATTAIFSIVYGVMLRPLPYPDSDRLVSLWMRYPQANLGPRIQVNAADHHEWQARNHVFGEIGLVRAIANFNLTGAAEPERLFAARVTASTFRILGVTPAIGRTFTDDENEVGRDREVILSDGLWRRRFGGDRSIIGRDILLNGTPHTVIGVMRADFQYPRRDTQIWTPLTIDSDEFSMDVPPPNNYIAVARLKLGVSLEQARQEMDVISAGLAVEYARTPWGARLAAQAGGQYATVDVVPLLEDTVGDVQRALYVLLAAVLCLLLIACLNLATLVGARAAGRTQEFAVRLALGASRGRLGLQALAEVLPIVVGGGLLGVVAARASIAAFVPLASSMLPRVDSIQISAPVLLFSVAMLVLTALVAGVLPAVQAWRSQSLVASREDNRAVAGGAKQARMRAILVVSQLALVLPLLVAATLLTRSFAAVLRVDPGFRPDNVQTLQIAVSRSKYRTDAEVNAFCERLVAQVAAVPGVASAGMVNRLPLAGVGQVNPVEFDTAGAVTPSVSSDTRSVTPDYFRTMGIPVLDGRIFSDHERDAIPTKGFPPQPSVAIIDAQLARRYWPGQSAVGKRLRFGIDGLPWAEIVGVVGHVHHDGLDVDLRPQVYFSSAQRPQDRMALVARGIGDVRALAPAILRAIKEVDPEQPVYDVRMLEEVMDQSTSQRWLTTALIASFAVVALTLASIGIYGVISYGVAKQTREFGIRVALGARRVDITRLVLGRGAVLAAAGAIVGLLIALGFTRTMQALLFGVRPGDLTSFALGMALLMAIALIASYVPARRAASVDPAITLRGE